MAEAGNARALERYRGERGQSPNPYIKQHVNIGYTNDLQMIYFETVWASIPANRSVSNESMSTPLNQRNPASPSWRAN